MHFEGIAGAINVSIVAFSIVFAVLIVLTGTIFAMKLFSGSGEEKKNDVSQKPAPAPVSAKPAPVKAAPVQAPAVVADKAKIVAAITAAIIEFTGSESFRILSIEPSASGVIPGDRWTSRWKTAGMLNLNSNRLNRTWR